MSQTMHHQESVVCANLESFSRFYPDVFHRFFAQSPAYRSSHTAFDQFSDDWYVVYFGQWDQKKIFNLASLKKSTPYLIIISNDDVVVKITGLSDLRADIVDIKVGKNSSLTFIDHASHVSSRQLRVTIDSGAHCTLYGSYACAESAEWQLELNLGPYATIFFSALVKLSSSGNLTINLAQNHQGPHSTSRIKIYGIVDDQAQLAYAGTIMIAPDAPGSDAHQENKNLIIASGGRVRSVPSLQVKNKAVSCGHASAVGFIDPEQVLYLQTRGYSCDAARQLLIDAFGQSLFSTLALPEKEYLKLVKKGEHS